MTSAPKPESDPTEPGAPAPLPGRRPRRRTLVLAGAGVLVAGAAAGVLLSVEEPAPAPAADVKPTVTITACAPASVDAQVGTLGYTITNNSSRTRLYVVNFVLKDGSGSRVGDGSDISTTLAAGQTVQDQAFVNGGTRGGASCELAEVIDAS